MRVAGICFVFIVILMAFQYMLFDGLSDISMGLYKAQNNLDLIKFCFWAQVSLFLIAGISLVFGASNTEAKINELHSLYSKLKDSDNVSNNIQNDFVDDDILTSSTTQSSFDPRLFRNLQEIKNIIGDKDKKIVSDLIISFCKDHRIPKELSDINPEITKKVVNGTMPINFIESLFQQNIDDSNRIAELETIIRSELS